MSVKLVKISEDNHAFFATKGKSESRTVGVEINHVLKKIREAEEKK